MRRWIRDHSLTAVILIVLIAQTAYFGYTARTVWHADARTMGLPFWLWASHEYNLSVVADVWGALFLVHSTKLFREKGSPESGDEE